MHIRERNCVCEPAASPKTEEQYEPEADEGGFTEMIDDE